ncbi:hypothetical protein FHS18_003218 [Paenibacillus phyllosphaerae]|uniref:Lipoprotein n=1 Tax=Paenibacillus phyllosphaerae TaxID=274593 RepID=A0A7W5AYK0_9BACL|nr:hypothetical protein [Paenibacillus phyllosphaerae]MBB3111150.1 hypothetical protein [Paenibacillus phyllosphaerae]
MTDRRRKMRHGILVVWVGLALVGAGCESPTSSQVKPSPSQQQTPPLSDAGDTPELPVTESFVEATFQDFDLPAAWKLLYQGTHETADRTYTLYEYEWQGEGRPAIDSWLRAEAERLMGKLTERYSYQADASIDLMIELPTGQGTRLISSYTQTIMGSERLVIEETLLEQPTAIGADYEDHALVLYMPNRSGTADRVFKGEYEHQHTDIYLVYFYSQAFFEELTRQKRMPIEVRYRLGETDYEVGYFNANGESIFPEELTEENRDQYVFGVQLSADFLPQQADLRQQLLFYWAKTILLGDKAHSRTLIGNEQIHFLKKGKILASFSVKDVMEGSS